MNESLTFLSPVNNKIATKVFEYKKNQWYEVETKPGGKWFMGYSVPVKGLQDSFEVLKKVEDHPYFLIHGCFKKGVDLNEPLVRRKKEHPLDNLPATIKDREIHFVCFDIDGYEDNKLGIPRKRIEDFIKKELPAAFQTADYIYQLSSSYGLTTQKLKCHLFFWLLNSVKNTVIQKWVKRYNQKKDWGNLVDPNIYTSNQPIYIQKRICRGAADPFLNNHLELIKKSGVLEFDFALTPDLHSNFLKKKNLQQTEKTLKYDVADGIKKILLSENYHDELNKMALALLNRKISPETVKEWLEGAMTAAKATANTPERLETWEIRFKDIGRSVDSAVRIINNLTIDEVLEWISSSGRNEIMSDFPVKALKLDALEERTFIEALEQKLGLGRAPIKALIKTARTKEEKKKRKEQKEKIHKERKALGIHEIMITLSNTESVCEKVSRIVSKSTNGDQVFNVAGGLAKVTESQPKTIRQVIKKDQLGEDYPPLPVIYYYQYHSLGARIEKDVVFFNQKKKEISCPVNILKIINEDVGSYFPPLSGIIEHPFIDTNFNIVQQNGYNKQTGLFSVLHRKLKIKLINAKKAYKFLAFEMFDEFPFQSELDRAVAVAALLTCVQRPMIAGDSGFPGFGIVSPVQSSGKTTLAQLISYSVYNRAVAATNFSTDDDELSKHLLAILKEGHSCVLFDNLPQGTEVKSNVLAKIMSSDTFSGRLLGDTKTIEVPASVVWLFTGNGIYFVGDFATRIYPININVNMENPESRIFKRDNIGEWAIENRKKILSAVLSIVLEAKKKNKLKEGGRFKTWDYFVRKPIFSVSGIDINNAIISNKKNDSFQAAKIRLFFELKKVFGLGKEFTTRDLLIVAFKTFEDGIVTSSLGEILLELLDNKARNPRTVGRFLATLKNVILGGLVLKTNFFASTMIKWRVEKAD